MYTACSRTRCGASRFPVARRRSKAMANVASFLDATAARQPDGKALVHAARSYSFAALRSMADGVARGLVAEGYGPGSRIALACANRPGFIAAYYGILKPGGLAVVLSTTLRERDIRFQLEDSATQAPARKSGVSGKRW